MEPSSGLPLSLSPLEDDPTLPESTAPSTSTSSVTTSPIFANLPRPDESGLRPSGFNRKRTSVQTPVTPAKRTRPPRIQQALTDADSVNVNSPIVNLISPSNDSRPELSRTFSDYFRTNFFVLKKLGSGSFGDVFHVKDINENHFAVKKSRVQYRGRKDRAQKLNEVDNLKKIKSHPHCVQLIEAWEQFGHLYIRTELCADGNLRQQMDKIRESEEKYSLDTIFSYLLDILLALQHIHMHGMAHLDVKPANLLIQQGSIKVGDFGIATQLWKDKNAQDGDRLYMAPELLNSNPSYAADIFSLGLILLEMATLENPPEEGVEWRALREGQVQVWPGFSDLNPNLAELALAMLHPNPEKRPTADDLLKWPVFESLLKQRAIEPHLTINPVALWTHKRSSFSSMASDSTPEHASHPHDMFSSDDDGFDLRASDADFHTNVGSTCVDDGMAHLMRSPSASSSSSHYRERSWLTPPESLSPASDYHHHHDRDNSRDDPADDFASMPRHLSFEDE